jgi:hypothetical protein
MQEQGAGAGAGGAAAAEDSDVLMAGVKVCVLLRYFVGLLSLVLVDVKS